MKLEIHVKEDIPFLERLRLEAIESSRGKSWLVRVPVLIWLFYIFINYLKNPQYYNFLIGPVNLVFHEAGHVIFMFFGEFMHTLGGSLFECLLPLLLALAFLRERDFFGISFCLGWSAIAIFDTAIYVSDARERVLPLLGGDPENHDWYNLLTDLNLLAYDDTIATFLRMLATVLMIGSLAFGIWVLKLIYQNREASSFLKENLD